MILCLSVDRDVNKNSSLKGETRTEESNSVLKHIQEQGAKS